MKKSKAFLIIFIFSQLFAAEQNKPLDTHIDSRILFDQFSDLIFQKKDISEIKKFLEENIGKFDINSKTNFFKNTCLHCAIIHRRMELVQLLIKYKADLNSKDNLGKSPLYYAAYDAAYYQDETIFKLLFDSGAKVDDSISHAREKALKHRKYDVEFESQKTKK